MPGILGHQSYIHTQIPSQIRVERRNYFCSFSVLTSETNGNNYILTLSWLCGSGWMQVPYSNAKMFFRILLATYWWQRREIKSNECQFYRIRCFNSNSDCPLSKCLSFQESSGCSLGVLRKVVFFLLKTIGQKKAGKEWLQKCYHLCDID